MYKLPQLVMSSDQAPVDGVKEQQRLMRGMDRLELRAGQPWAFALPRQAQVW